jgi:hypothetical protein
MLLGGALGVTRGTSTPGVRDHVRDEARRKALRSHVRVYLKSKRAATAFISRFNGSSLHGCLSGRRCGSGDQLSDSGRLGAELGRAAGRNTSVRGRRYSG